MYILSSHEVVVRSRDSGEYMCRQCVLVERSDVQDRDESSELQSWISAVQEAGDMCGLYCFPVSRPEYRTMWGVIVYSKRCNVRLAYNCGNL